VKQCNSLAFPSPVGHCQNGWFSVLLLWLHIANGYDFRRFTTV